MGTKSERRRKKTLAQRDIDRQTQKIQTYKRSKQTNKPFIEQHNKLQIEKTLCLTPCVSPRVCVTFYNFTHKKRYLPK